MSVKAKTTISRKQQAVCFDQSRRKFVQSCPRTVNDLNKNIRHFLVIFWSAEYKNGRLWRPGKGGAPEPVLLAWGGRAGRDWHHLQALQEEG